MAFCLRCGARMGRAKAHGRRVLRCARHAEKARTGLPCHPNYTREDQAVAAVAAFVVGLADPQALEAALHQGQDPNTPDLAAELQIQARRVATLEDQRKRLALAYAARQMDPGVYRRADQELAGRLDVAQTQAAKLKIALESRPDPQTRRAALQAAISKLPHLLAEGDPGQISALLQKAGIQAHIENGEVVLITFAA